jgi:hypothetical protein
VWAEVSDVYFSAHLAQKHKDTGVAGLRGLDCAGKGFS